MDLDFSLPAELDTRTRAQSGVAMPVRNMQGAPVLDKEGNAVTITLLGSDSDVYRRLVRDQVRKRIARASAGQEPSDDDDGDALGILVACTVAWAGVNTPAGEPIPCQPDYIRALYVRYPIIREQADSFVSARGNFTAASSGE